MTQAELVATPWEANPAMVNEIEAYRCMVGKRIAIWVWRCTGKAWQYTISAGANSDLSMSGCLYPETGTKETALESALSRLTHDGVHIEA